MRIAAALMLLLVSAGLAKAETMEVRPSAPVAEVSIPAGWKTSRIERGVQAVSKDGEVYFWVEAYKPDEFDAILGEHNAYWKKQNVVITSSDEEKEKVGDLEMSMTTEHATWKGDPTVLYYLEFHLGVPSQSNIVLTYWASPEGDKAHQSEVSDVIASMQSTEK